MIYTVTLNPSIDYIVHVDKLEIGGLNRMKQDFKLPGGKGLNVSRILKRLDGQTTALGFLGGFTGDFIGKWIEQEGIINEFTSIKEDTRINVKLKAGEETEINGLGPVVSDTEITDLKEKLAHITSEDIVVLSGSMAPSLPSDFYESLITIIKAKGADFIIDTTGKALLEAIPHQPLLIKPNNHELAELFQTSFSKTEDMFPYGEQLLKNGAKHVLISLGGDGSILFTKDGIYQANVPKGTLKNSVGSGDSMIAGFVGQFEKTKDPLEAFKYGVACGSATAFSDDLATAEKIRSLIPEVQIKKVK
ncbi:1-phosphofructokinase [Vagococcus entomophilus]|uniref:Tagatose-6-phosphate kinase n=1 Tax=Vagococcus entomophilus TaxID=1160095 RepID=A0A430AJQ8_9ENTE|nr:1-phosphofructokinase [Vagococcus entomophilus]RSU08289.1 1-phosphofructokinase [Vagococcus entomophilus]